MKKLTVVLSLLLCVLFSIARAQEPRIVLFETFTNSCDMCPYGNLLDEQFKATLASSLGPKVIHLNHHCVNVCDHLAASAPQSLNELIRLSEVEIQPYPLFNGAVDHTIFSFTGTRITSGVPGTPRTEWD